ncbi:MAG: hypothetical protein AAF202_07460, partial [Pseudomonadota bacterium]
RVLTRSELAREYKMAYMIHVTNFGNLRGILGKGKIAPGSRLGPEVEPGFGDRGDTEVYLQAISEKLMGKQAIATPPNAVEFYSDLPDLPYAKKGKQAIILVPLQVLDRSDYIPTWGWNFGGESGEEFPLRKIHKLFRNVRRSPKLGNQFRFRSSVEVGDSPVVLVHPEDKHRIADLKDRAEIIATESFVLPEGF